MEGDVLTEKIIGIFYRVYNKLGYGFLEKVYENAMVVEFEQEGINFKNQVPIKVHYEGRVVGDYVADFVIDNKIIVELKAMQEICESHKYQLLNYLRATNNSVGLLLNFGSKPRVRRMVYNY